MKFSEKEIKQRLEELDNWNYKSEAIQTTYTFKNFKDAFAAMTRIAFEVEKVNHHPDWKNVYNRLEISLTTHEEGGVTEKDFELAKIIDTIVDEMYKNQ